MIGELCFATVSGRGPDGYSDALAALREQLDRSAARERRRRESGAATARARAHRAPRGELRERELDVLLVDALIDLRYLTGFTGSNGLALVRARPGATVPAPCS